MSETEVVTLMMSSRSEEEWDDNCDKVKASHGGRYPGFWWQAIQMSGVAAITQGSWPKKRDAGDA